MVWNWLIQACKMKTGFIMEIQKQLTRAGSKNICISTRITSQIKTFDFLKCKAREKLMQILANSNLLSISFRWFFISWTLYLFIFVFRFVAHESLICTNAIHNTINFVLMKMFCENSLCFAQFIISPISSFENISS